MGPYRGAEVAVELHCPRCAQRLPPVDVAACKAGCGSWVTAFASSEVLTDDERRPDLITRWWRKREGCPLCGVQMILRGDREGHFQGCDGHGFWIDADAIPHTGLARGVDQGRLDRKRDDETRMATDREVRAAAEHEREQRAHDKQAREARLAKAIREQPVHEPPPAEPGLDLGALLSDGASAASMRSLRRRVEVLEAFNEELQLRIAALERERTGR